VVEVGVSVRLRGSDGGTVWVIVGLGEGVDV
jgi:hypothetical protein